MIEYKIIPLPKTVEEINEELNNFSRKGWRIVCSCGKDSRHVILKKRLREQEEDYE